MAEHGDGNIKVVVRCRPLNSRGQSSRVYLTFLSCSNGIWGVTELARGAKPLIRMQGNQTFIDPPEGGSAQDSKRATERKTMTFSFDKSYWSAGPRDEPQYCSQQTLYEDLGKELLDHGFLGFNACILACECTLVC
jgi:kinesin family member 1